MSSSVVVALLNKGNVKITAMLIGLQAITTGLLMIPVARLFNSLVGGAMSYFSSDSNAYKMSAFKGFILVAIGSAILSCLFAAAVMLAAKVMHQKITYKQALCGSAVRGLAIAPVNLVVLVLSYISLGLAFVLATINFLSVAFSMEACSVLLRDKRKYAAYVVAVALIVVLLGQYILLRTCGTMLLPSAMKEMLENPGNILGYLM